MTSKLDFLAQLPIFKALTEPELKALARISQEYEFEEGAVIAYQRDVADSLYIVRNGRLFARSVDGRGIVRETHAYGPQDYFDARWLFAEDAHPATIRATEPGSLIIIKGSDFLEFLDRNRRVLPQLEPEFGPEGHVSSGLSATAWEMAGKVRVRADRRSAAVSLLPDELVEYSSRRSIWFLLVRTLGPFLSMVLLPPVAYLLLVNFSAAAATIVAGLIGVAALLFLLFRALDWSNDYFVITNKHLIHREFDLRTFRTTINKIPMEKVQSVEIDKPTLVANLFNIGTARITTASAKGILYFDNIDDPIRVKDTLDRLSRQVRALDAGREQATMRRSLENYFQVQPSFTAVANGEGEGETAVAPTRESFWARVRKRYTWRSEENGVITYRKHFFILFREIAWPATAFILLFIAQMGLINIFQFTWAQIGTIFLILFVVDFGWLIWEIEDWRNDTFQLTDRYVIDIDRRPFGFGESRKQAELANVQNVNADRPGLIPTIFNYGNVIIETAGATADITFENVPHPSVIQSDVFRRRDAQQRIKQIGEGERRRKEYAVLLDVYKQAEEQGRLPRRTPHFEEVPDVEEFEEEY
ncbi:MAG: cyclic nucleotide-binding domain-containing protein [Ardenticatenaceae bacterium]|nr:cyclic nucleotide-binding domain-containing protein [Ardenticatenaceae bacterium]